MVLQVISQDKLQEINIVLLNSEPEMTTLVRESLGMGILDSACTRTVTGETWLNVIWTY